MNSHPTLEALQIIPARRGALPRITPANPQEPLGQFPPEWQLIGQLAIHAFALPGVIEQQTRVAPDGSRALKLAPGLPMEPRAAMVGREFAHIHTAHRWEACT